MEDDNDLYQILGVDWKADADEIRKAYKRLDRKCHPDLNPGDQVAAEQFVKVSEAYEVLSDPEKRQIYDHQGRYSETETVAADGSRAGGEKGEPDLAGKKRPILAAILAFCLGPLGCIYIGWKWGIAFFLVLVPFWAFNFATTNHLRLDFLLSLLPSLLWRFVLAWKCFILCDARNATIEKYGDMQAVQIVGDINSIPYIVMTSTDLFAGLFQYYLVAVLLAAAARDFLDGAIFKGIIFLLLGIPFALWLGNILCGLFITAIDALVVKKVGKIFERWN